MRKYVLVFFDDILIYRVDCKTHLSHLEEIMDILRSRQLYANKKKWLFGQNSVEYLGHIISKEGVGEDPTKVGSVQEWPIPKCKRCAWLLGLTGYYWKFIKEYEKVAMQLTDLTKKDAFCWNASAQQAFEELKRRITTVPVLALPNGPCSVHIALVSIFVRVQVWGVDWLIIRVWSNSCSSIWRLEANKIGWQSYWDIALT